jgi:hypothetical protein
MDVVKKQMKFLGLKVQDKVTGFTGIVSTMSFDLYGCIQAWISPMAKDGELKEGRWFDVTRLDVLDNKPVMELPDYSKGYVAEGKKGCCNAKSNPQQ